MIILSNRDIFKVKDIIYVIDLYTNSSLDIVYKINDNLRGVYSIQQNLNYMFSVDFSNFNDIIQTI